jgi:hypothetical protein
VRSTLRQMLRLLLVAWRWLIAYSWHNQVRCDCARYRIPCPAMVTARHQLTVQRGRHVMRRLFGGARSPNDCIEVGNVSFNGHGIPCVMCDCEETPSAIAGSRRLASLRA